MKKSIKVFTVLMLFGSLITAGFNQSYAEDAQLGVFLQALNDELRAETGYDGEGIFVIDLVEGSGAKKAGIKAGDIILAFHGRMVTSHDELIEAIKTTRPGDKVKVVIVRKSAPKTLTVVMGAKGAQEDIQLKETFQLKEGKRLQLRQPKRRGMTLKAPEMEQMIEVVRGRRPYMGISMVEMPDPLAAYFKVKHGVLISEVAKGSPAEKAGLEAGDVLISWNKKKIHNTQDLYEQLHAAKEGEGVALGFSRQGKKRIIEFELGTREAEGLASLGYTSEGKPGKMETWVWPKDTPMPPMPHFEGFEMGDLQKFKKDMEQLKKELKQMRKELKSLKDKR